MLARALGRSVHPVLAGPDGLDDLAFERLVAEELESLLDRVLVADERLPRP